MLPLHVFFDILNSDLSLYTLLSDIWVVIRDATSLQLGTLTVEGGLEIDYDTTNDYTLTVNFLIVNGGRFHVGWQDNPIQGTANIVLAGSKSSPMFTGIDGYTIGNKAMGMVKCWMILLIKL